MPPDPASPTADRDGTSQTDRIAPALRPGYVQVDERTTADLVSFSKEYGKRLRYFGLDDRADGVWDGLLPDSLTPAQIEEFADHPDRFSPADHPQLFRPHFSLFMAFLKLVERSRIELNGFTDRHLAHYYREVLGMTAKPPVPDSVNVIVDPASSASSDVSLPAGTLLSAGPDSSGREQTYAIDRELVINQAKVARLSTIHVEYETTGLEEERHNHGQRRRAAALAMLRLALGEPGPGDALAAYPGTTVEPTQKLLGELRELVAYSGEQLHLKLFEFGELMAKRRRRDTGADWAAINSHLAALAELNGVTLTIVDPRSFDDNLRVAVGGALPTFADINEVDDVYDLFDFKHLLVVQEAIRNDLGFADVKDFTKMMELKLRVDGDWHDVNELLGLAGRRFHHNAAFELTKRPDFDPTEFTRNVQYAIGESADRVPYPDRIDQREPPESTTYYDKLFDAYSAGLSELETYFSMSPEEYRYFMDAVDGTDWTKADPDETWRRADSILTEAHRSRVYAQRRATLRRLREDGGDDGVELMLRHVLGNAALPDTDPVAAIERFLGDPADLTVIKAAHRGEPADWDRLYVVAEIAQRNREGFVELVPERREWINLNAAADATAAAIPMGADGKITRWPTFGSALDPSAEELAPVIGWAVSSPILLCAEGERVIQLTLGIADRPAWPDQFAEVLADALAFEVTTETGWMPIEVDTPAIEFGLYADLGRGELHEERTDPEEQPDSDDGLAAVSFRLVIDQQSDPIAPLPADQPGLGTTWPVLRVTLKRRETDNRFTMPYPEVSQLRLVAARLHVAVSGLATLRLRNDDTAIDPSAPFEPFSRSPVAGSRFLIGHSELATKKLDSVSFRFEWMGVPPNLTTTYYVNYPFLADVTKPTFTADIHLVDRRNPVKLGDIDLFAASPQRFPDIDFVAPGALPNAFVDGELPAWDRYLSWELGSPDFQHGVYAQLSSQKSMEMAAAISRNEVIGPTEDNAKNVPITNFQVNPPYTPKMKSFAVDYSSSMEFPADQDQSSPGELFHLHPFGYSAISIDGTTTGVPLLPQYDNEGELYIGLSGFTPPRTLTLLFQMAEGSADPDRPPATLEWSSASGGNWRPLEEGSVQDTTRGLITSGIIQLELPEADPATRLDGDLYWVRVVAARNSSSIADIVAIHTQSISATFVDDDNAADHYAQPLPADSITKTTTPIAGIAGIRQPYTSRGGRMAEEPDRFATRVSERLRHKQRALSMWDYEHLALEQFPQLFKVKCIPPDPRSTAFRPGAVDVVVIPDIRNTLPFNSFEPKAPPELLAEIHDYLATRAPSTARLSVKNARFRAVKVGCGVRFIGAGNDDYYKQLLSGELERFLSPWAFDEGADIAIGSKIYATSIVNFIDRREYVDYVADVRLYFSDDGIRYHPAPEGGQDGYHVKAGPLDGVIRAAREHEITSITGDVYRAETITGIGFMKIDLDFTVRPPTEAEEDAIDAARPVGVGSAYIGMNLIIG